MPLPLLSIRVSVSNIIAPLAALFALSALAGCMERKERWTIESDGSVRAQLRYEADSPAELYDGDAPPGIEGGWIVTEDIIEKPSDDGGDSTFTYVLNATGSFSPDTPLPDHYDGVIGSQSQVDLLFPTTVTFEQRRDGVYVHFQRRYRARPWSFVDRPRQAYSRQHERLLGQSIDQMTIADRTTFLQALAKVEVLRFTAFAREAFESISHDVPQDQWLGIRRAISAVAENRDYETIARLLGDAQSPPNYRELNLAGQQFERDVLDAIRATLRGSPWVNASKLLVFEQEFSTHRRRYEISEDVRDDTFDIVVDLPGELVDHNGVVRADGAVSWRFSGDMLMDRDHELIATSRIITR